MKTKHNLTLSITLLSLCTMAITALAAEPKISCGSSGCTVENALTENLIEQIRQQGKLSANWLKLKNIGNDDLKPLAALKTELRYLEIGSFKNLTDITPLSQLTGLMSLKLDSLEKLADLTPIAKLTKLTTLEVKWVGFTSFKFLQPLNNLEKLIFASPAAECTDNSVLAKKTKLKILDLSGVQIKDIAALKDATQLEKLYIGRTQIENLTPLTTLKNLKSLNLNGGVPAKDFSPVGALTELTYLNLENTNFADYSALAGCTKLGELIAWKSGFNTLDVIAQMPNLKQLLLSNTKVQEWDALKTAKNLQELRVAQTSFSDVSLLAGLEKLKRLDLSETTITHPESLGQLPNLELLTLLKTQGVNDLSVLKSIPNLSTLYLTKGQFPQEQIDMLQAAKPKLRMNFY